MSKLTTTTAQETTQLLVAQFEIRSVLTSFGPANWTLELLQKRSKNLFVVSVVGSFKKNKFLISKTLKNQDLWLFQTFAMIHALANGKIMENKMTYKGHCDGYVVSVLTFFSDNPSSNSAEVYTFYVQMLLKKATTNKKTPELKKNDVMEPFLPCHCCLHNWKSTLFWSWKIILAFIQCWLSYSLDVFWSWRLTSI